MNFGYFSYSTALYLKKLGRILLYLVLLQRGRFAKVFRWNLVTVKKPAIWMLVGIYFGKQIEAHRVLSQLFHIGLLGIQNVLLLIQADL